MKINLLELISTHFSKETFCFFVRLLTEVNLIMKS
jgi:hypothetical protein